MSSQVEELMPVALGKGCNMRIFIDHAKPTDDMDHNWTETTYDGKPDSLILSIPAHWHEHHDEIMHILSGSMTFTIANRTITATPSNSPLTIPRGTIHGFKVLPGEAVTFTERTVPSGDFKALFFQDLFQAGIPGPLLAMRAFYDGDTYISLPGGWKGLDWIFMCVFGFVAKGFVPRKLGAVKRIGKGGGTLGGGDDGGDGNLFGR